MLSFEDRKKLCRQELNYIYRKNWNFMKNIFQETPKLSHRSKPKSVPNIQVLKKEVSEKLGDIAPFVFLTDFLNTIPLPGPYNNIDKGVCILYHLISGDSFLEMDDYIKKSTFYSITNLF